MSWVQGAKVQLVHYPEQRGTVMYKELGTDRVRVYWTQTGLESWESVANLTNLSYFELPKSNKTCNHSYKLYTGFVEQYWFCTLCDIKKELQSDISGSNFS